MYSETKSKLQLFVIRLLVAISILLILLWTVGSHVLSAYRTYLIISNDSIESALLEINKSFLDNLDYDEAVIYIENLVPFLIGIQLLSIYYTFGVP